MNPSLMNPLYTLACWPYGWVALAGQGQHGIPIEAVTNLTKLAKKGAVVAPGIAHSLQVTTHHDVVMVVCTQKELEIWEAEIAKDNERFSPPEAWWRGTDVGCSSAAIFAVLAKEENPALAAAASRKGKGDLPRDPSDFGRCFRLLEKIPAWKTRLPEVAAAYPDAKWPALIDKWDELSKLYSENDGPAAYAILKEIQS